jgi:hypothetical protein
MTPVVVLRTLIVGAWIAALLAHAEPGGHSALLTAALVLLWAAPLARDRLRARAAGPLGP